jgi:hypothetical protein
VSRSRAAPILLALLIAASGVSFLRAEQLKLQHSALQHPKVKQAFSPACPGQPRCRSKAVLEFTLGKAQPVALRIVDADGNTVRALTDGEIQTPKGKVRTTWDGRDDHGELAPDGRYRLAVTLGGDDRTITIPAPINLDTVAPTVAITRVDRTPQRVVIHFLPSEQARTFRQVRLDGKVIDERPTRHGFSKFSLHDRDPGTYILSVLAVDHAGNTTENPPTVRVKVP